MVLYLARIGQHWEGVGGCWCALDALVCSAAVGWHLNPTPEVAAKAHTGTCLVPLQGHCYQWSVLLQPAGLCWETAVRGSEGS